MTEWLRPLIFSTLNHSSSHRCGLTAVGSSLAQVTCETSQVLLAGGQVVFLEDLPFLPHLAIDRLKMSKIILMGRKTQIKKKKEELVCQNWVAALLYLSHVTGKPVFGVCDQLRLKPACSADETS